MHGVPLKSQFVFLTRTTALSETTSLSPTLELSLLSHLELSFCGGDKEMSAVAAVFSPAREGSAASGFCSYQELLHLRVTTVPPAHWLLMKDRKLIFQVGTMKYGIQVFPGPGRTETFIEMHSI